MGVLGHAVLGQSPLGAFGSSGGGGGGSVLGYAVLGHLVLGQVGGGSTTPGAGFTLPDPRCGQGVYVVGDTIAITWRVTHDVDGRCELVTPTTVAATITHEDGGTLDITAQLEEISTGVYVVGWVPAIPGRIVATPTTAGPGAGVTELVIDVQPRTLAFLGLAELRTYLGASGATDPEILDALTVEQNDQAEWCRIDPYTPALREALKRRVARNLHARRIPTAPISSYGQGVTGVVATTQLDAEIARLEASRRLPGFA